MNEIVILPEAQDELEAIPPREQAAVLTAMEKLKALGQNLGYPHSSQVKDTTLRELRPRAGNSPWRAFYR